ncbi:MAG: isochorismate synthase, partial [Actinomyces sp.]
MPTPTDGLRVEELAAAADVAVDTVRYYQRRGLLPPPRRVGRVALYDAEHLSRLRRIRHLAGRGFTLAQIGELLEGHHDGLLAALGDEAAVDPSLDRAELARRAGVPEVIVDVVVGAGLLTPVAIDGRECFAPDAVDMLVAARTLVAGGVAIEELTALALRHAVHVEDVVDDALELFRRRVGKSGDRSALVELVPRLVPVATGLVARHFERTLLERALRRLGDEPAPALDAPLVAVARRVAVDPAAAVGTLTDLVGDAPRLLAAVEAAHPVPGGGTRSVWLRPDEGTAVAALGVADRVEPAGPARFTAASAARVALAARVRRIGPSDAPAPLLVGGFAFGVGDDPRPPRWAGFPDARLVLPALTVVVRGDGVWLVAAARGADATAAERTADAWLDAAEDHLARHTPSIPGETETPAGSASDPADAALTATTAAPHHADPDADRAAYTEAVATAVAAIGAGVFDKVVLARRRTRAVRVDPARLVTELARRNPGCAVFAFRHDDAVFCGATPEELVVLDGRRLRTVALAGTAPRHADPDLDAAEGRALLVSEKNRAEHAFVVDAVTRRLAELGLVDPTPAEPELVRLARVQHLRTPITARVERRRGGVSDMDVLRVAGVLHPTPAVGGTPDAAALEFITRHEDFDRGWYAAPVGWCDLDGNGELRVALRSALLDDEGVHVFAGAGIVAASDPDAEFAETELKMAAMLDVID